MKHSQRFDIQKIDRGSIEETPQGFLRFPVYAARTGIQIYRSDDGQIIREYRPPEEVFAEDTMKSMRGVPFTNRHPKKMVDLDNARELMVGMGGDTIQAVDNKFTKTFVTVTDKATIEDILEHGIVEVSMGYDVNLEFTPGEVDGERYDAIQRNIVMNHMALVPRGRGGPEVRLRIDSPEGMDYAVSIFDRNDSNGGQMKIKIGDSEFEVNEDLFKALKSEREKHDAALAAAKETKTDESEVVTGLKDQLKDERAKSAELSKAKDILQAKVDSAEEGKGAGKTDAAAIDEAVRERRKVERVAERVLDAETVKKIDDMPTRELKEACIKAEYPNAKLDNASEVYVGARFDSIAETLDVSDDSNKAAGKTVVNKRKTDGENSKTDSGDKEVAEALERSQKADEEAWKQPIGKTKSA